MFYKSIKRSNKFMCEKCDNLVPFTINTRKVTVELNHMKIKYDELYATCDKCNSEMIVPRLEDINVQTLYDKYLERGGTLSKDEISSIRNASVKYI